VVVHRTGGHTPGHSVIRLASGGDRLTFAGDAVFAVGFDHPEWYNGFEHDPEEAARVRVRLLRGLPANREPLVAIHLSFPSVCHVAVAGDAFRCVPATYCDGVFARGMISSSHRRGDVSCSGGGRRLPR
jgi:hypothetical protein